MSIIREELRIGNLQIIDTGQFNMPGLTSLFCWYDGEKALLMDAGTSQNTEAILSSLERNGIPAEKLAGVVPSHYHFDHGGGSAELWKRMQGINSSFRIYTTQLTADKLNSSASHLKGASTTFGSFVGTMEPLPYKAFHIVEPDSWLPLEFNDGARIKLLHTPGHTPDHSSPSVFKEGRCIFCFAAEASGTLYTWDRILSTPSSMPPNFSYSHYIESMDKIRSITPEIIGLCHFGVIAGPETVNAYFNEHLDFMKRLREEIIRAFSEEPSTVHVMDSTAYLWEGRLQSNYAATPGSGQFFRGLRLALTYGIMVDLGFREPRYEERIVQQ